jgi:uncharacterized protein YdeI (YjbR/CyaY-like superfamily)
MRPVPSCPELARELRRSKRLQKFFNSLDPDTCKMLVIDPILQAKKPETRKRRAAQTAEWLLEVMEAERELPPLFQAAFARNLQARQGWERIPVLLRRKYLLGILHSRHPETRGKQMKYATEEIARWAPRNASTGDKAAGA